MDNWQLPIDWAWKALPEICVLNPKRPRLQRADDVPTSFVPMQAVDEVEGKITGMETRKYEEVKRGYTYFEENDVLMAKITPSMENGKAAIAQNLIDGIGFGTTEFHVFRPREGILPAWIFYFIRRLSFRLEAKSHFRGAVGQQRVPEDFLKSYEIPIPFPNDPARSLETQKRIVLRLETLLGEVKSARELQESIEEDTGQLLDAFLGETFSEKSNWDVFPIIRFAEVKGGKRLPKGEKFAEGTTEFPYLRVVDFKDFSIEKESLKYLTPEIQQTIRRYTISKEDVYISIAGTIGLVGTIPPELDGSNLTENAAKIVFRPEYKDKIDPLFIAYYLASPLGKEQIKKYTMAAGQPKLALIRIQTIDVPLPDINIQKSIVNRISTVREEISEMQRAQRENAALLEQTEQSLLAQAFRGEL